MFNEILQRIVEETGGGVHLELAKKPVPPEAGVALFTSRVDDPDDLEYDGRMTEHIANVYQDPETRAKYMEDVIEALPEKTFRMHAKFESHCYVDIKAKTQDEAYEIARDMDGGDFISSEERDGSWEVYECEDMDAE